MPIPARKQILSWCMYDFANSTYSAVIAAVIFPVYYTSQIVTDGSGDLWWGRAISLSMLIVAIVTPFLGGMADYSGSRKKYLTAFTLLSVISIAMLSLLEPGMAFVGFLIIVAANVGMEGALVFYNAYLIDISPPGHMGRVSSWGFALGYAGSVLSLLIALPLVRSGMFDAVWFMVAGLFLVFSVPALRFLPMDRPTDSSALSMRQGFREIAGTLRSLLAQKDARMFLIAYFLYADGVSTVIVFSSLFAAETLGFRPSELVMLYMAVQVFALIGSLGMARRTDTWGAKRVVQLSLSLWVVVTVASSMIYTKPAYWCIAMLAGLSLGTVQAASRALYAEVLPRGHEAESFGVFAFAGKSSAIIGPLLFGFISTSFGSQRPAVLAVSLFFITGMLVLMGVKKGLP